MDEVFAALADPTPRSVLATLLEGGPATATELAPGFAVSRQAVVKHLGVLADAGLVDFERHGREVHYRAVTAPLRDAAAWPANAGAAWDKRLARLTRALGEQ